MAHLSGYSKYKVLTLTGGASGAQTNFQLKIAVSYEAAMDGEFDDIRFTQADGETLIDAWAEVIVTDTSATVWVEFPTTPANTVEQTYYMYYGNAGAASDWDGAATFIQHHGAASANFLDALVIPSSSYVYEVRAKRIGSGGTDNAIWGIGTAAYITGDNAFIQTYSPNNKRYLQCGNNGTRSNVNEVPDFDTGVWYKGKIVWSGSGSVHGYWDDNEIGAGVSTNLPNETMGLKMYEAAGSFEQDWSFARKYAANPPTYAFGAEQSVPTGGTRLPRAFLGPFRGGL